MEVVDRAIIPGDIIAQARSRPPKIDLSAPKSTRFAVSEPGLRLGDAQGGRLGNVSSTRVLLQLEREDGSTVDGVDGSELQQVRGGSRRLAVKRRTGSGEEGRGRGRAQQRSFRLTAICPPSDHSADSRDVGLARRLARPGACAGPP